MDSPYTPQGTGKIPTAPGVPWLGKTGSGAVLSPLLLSAGSSSPAAMSPGGSRHPSLLHISLGGLELLPSPCLFWVTALSKQCTQQPATRPPLSKLSSAAALRRSLSLHVPVTGPASSQRRQMRSGSRMLWENPPPTPRPCGLLLFSMARFKSAASPREKTQRQGGWE